MELTRSMSVDDFESSYFYAQELKIFAKEIGITVGNFRKIRALQGHEGPDDLTATGATAS
jgi:hypothetical protein